MTVYANVVDGEVKGVYDLIPKFWNGQNNFNILCNNDPEFMRNNGFVKIVRDTTEFDPSLYRMSDYPTYSVSDGKVYEHRALISVTPPEPPTREELLVPIRMQRDKLMADFEWRYTRHGRQIRLGVTPTDDIVAMDVYMQALADITNQIDLTNIVWPTYQE